MPSSTGPAPTPVRRTGTPRRTGRLRRTLTRAALVVWVVVSGCWQVNLLTGTLPHPRPTGLTYVRTGDVETRVVRHGPATGAGRGTAAVVLVPGAAESADTWEPVARRLGGTRRVVAYDVVGWGYTERVGPYDLDHATRQLLALVDAEHLDRPVLVGHSSGAAVVAEAALRAPDKVGAVMLLDGDALPTGAGARSPARFVVLPPYRTTLLRLALLPDATVRAVYDAQCGPRCPRLDRAGVETWRAPFRYPGAEDALWAMLDTGVLGVPADRLAGLARLDLPKAVVFGAQDDVFPPGTPEQTARRVGAPAPQLIPDARHLTPVSDPDVVAAAVDRLASERDRVTAPG